MEKKTWMAPKAEDLSVKMTEYGQTVKEHVDDSIDYQGYTYFSFS